MHMSNQNSWFVIGAIIAAIVAFEVPFVAGIFYSALLIYGVSMLIGLTERLAIIRRDLDLLAGAKSEDPSAL